MKQKRFILLAVAVTAVLYLIIRAFLNQPDASELKGKFKEVAFVRNEQNTGPVIRIYGATVEKMEDAQFQAYGDLMPHTKYGTTTVYFFKNGEPVPNKLNIDTPNYDTTRYRPVAKYVKNPIGNTRLLLLHP